MIPDTVKVAVCGDTPGPVCLQGGCGYCGEYDSEVWMTVAQLRKHAYDNGWAEDFTYGRDRSWPNYWKKDGRKKFHASPVNMAPALPRTGS